MSSGSVIVGLGERERSPDALGPRQARRRRHQVGWIGPRIWQDSQALADRWACSSLDLHKGRGLGLFFDCGFELLYSSTSPPRVSARVEPEGLREVGTAPEGRE